MTKYIKSDYEKHSKSTIDSMFLSACFSSDNELAFFLAEEMNANIFIEKQNLADALSIAIQKNNLELISFLLKTNKLNSYFNINDKSLFKISLMKYSSYFEYACILSKISTIEYLIDNKLHFPLIKDKYQNLDFLFCSLKNKENTLDKTLFLLNYAQKNYNFELSEFKHYENSFSFLTTALAEKNIPLLKHLIFHCDVKKDESFIKFTKNSNELSLVEQLFERKRLLSDLSFSLDFKKIKESKFKV